MAVLKHSGGSPQTLDLPIQIKQEHEIEQTDTPNTRDQDAQGSALMGRRTDEDDAGLDFVGEGEDGGREALRVAQPLCQQRRRPDVQKSGARLLCKRLQVQVTHSSISFSGHCDQLLYVSFKPIP